MSPSIQNQLWSYIDWCSICNISARPTMASYHHQYLLVSELRPGSKVLINMLYMISIPLFLIDIFLCLLYLNNFCNIDWLQTIQTIRVSRVHFQRSNRKKSYIDGKYSKNVTHNRDIKIYISFTSFYDDSATYNVWLLSCTLWPECSIRFFPHYISCFLIQMHATYELLVCYIPPSVCLRISILTVRFMQTMQLCLFGLSNYLILFAGTCVLYFIQSVYGYLHLIVQCGCHLC